MALTKQQITRYSRQLILPEIGVSGQQKLLDASVLIIGAGGLGSPAALYLAAAGVGHMAIMDDDAVAVSNLHRQILHTSERVGTAKAVSAVQSLKAINPDAVFVPIHERFTQDNALEQIRGYDLVVDGSDNFATRYLVNDACVLARKPFIYGGVVGFGGQVMSIMPGQSACFRCVFPEPPQAGEVPNCQEAGVIGAAAGVIGSLMALEAIKLMTSVGRALFNRLAIFDGQTSQWRQVMVQRDLHCAVCGDSPTIKKPATQQQAACDSLSAVLMAS